MIKEIQNMYKSSMVDENIAITRGYNMAFGVLSKGMIGVLGDWFLDTLLQNCVPKGTQSDEAESRRRTVRALI